jgi:hypothetical protein
MTQPAPLIAALHMQIVADLDKLRSVKRATVNYNLTLQRLATSVNQDLRPLIAAADAIPPASVTLADYTAWLASPLIELIFAADPQMAKDDIANLDATLQQSKLTAVVSTYARYLNAQYVAALSALPSWDSLRLAKTYLTELARIDYRAEDYAYSLRVVSQFRGLGNSDPSLLTIYTAGPMYQFEIESRGFTYTGVVPDEFDAPVMQFLGYMADADAKLRAWAALGATGLH